jgi:uncharacterized protein
VTIYSKFARGNMVNWLIKNKVESIDKIKEFSGLGYIFSNSLSTNTELVFLR